MLHDILSDWAIWCNRSNLKLLSSINEAKAPLTGIHFVEENLESKWLSTEAVCWLLLRWGSAWRPADTTDSGRYRRLIDIWAASWADDCRRFTVAASASIIDIGRAARAGTTSNGCSTFARPAAAARTTDCTAHTAGRYACTAFPRLHWNVCKQTKRKWQTKNLWHQAIHRSET